MVLYIHKVFKAPVLQGHHEDVMGGLGGPKGVTLVTATFRQRLGLCVFTVYKKD